LQGVEVVVIPAGVPRKVSVSGAFNTFSLLMHWCLVAWSKWYAFLIAMYLFDRYSDDPR
jgi:hypothetical protein